MTPARHVRRVSRRSGWRSAPLLAGALALAGCAAGAQAEDAESPLANTFDSRDELIVATLEGLFERDRDRLATYLIERDEWEQLLWPEMPDQDHTPFEFVWGLSSKNSQKGLSQAIQEYGGLPFEFVSLEYTKEPEIYPSFTLHKGAQVLVRRPDTGEEGIIPIFDVFVEYGGTWKLMNFDEI